RNAWFVCTTAYVRTPPGRGRQAPETRKGRTVAAFPGLLNATRDSIAQQRRAPGEAAAERLQQQQLAPLHAAGTNRLVQGQRHRAGGGVAVAVDGDYDAAHRHLQALGRGLDDAQVGLVRDQPVQVTATQAVG